MGELIDGEVVSEETTFIPDVPFAKSVLGHCMTGHHGPNEWNDGCPGYVKAFEFIDPAAPRRKGQPPKTYTRPARRCPCPCHARDLD